MTNTRTQNRLETVEAATAVAGVVLSGSIKGDDSAEYTFSGAAGQILSVDLLSKNGAMHFNITPKGATEALVMGASSGTVADVMLPAAGGEYVVQVYMMRADARRDEVADYTLGIWLAGGDFADGVSGGPDWWQVSGLLGESVLSIRSGPHTRYPVLNVAGNGQLGQNRCCRMTGPDRWCSVRFDGSGQQGWVAGRFLTEAAAATPEVPTGGPFGNSVPFDATGELPCATAASQPKRSCPFGVVRDGPGNAGVWIVLGEGKKRAILFEGGVPVSADSPEALNFEKVDDPFTVRVGAESYEIVEAVISGG